MKEMKNPIADEKEDKVLGEYSSRVVRGGGWHNRYPINVQTAHRSVRRPLIGEGFRIVRNKK